MTLTPTLLYCGWRYVSRDHSHAHPTSALYDEELVPYCAVCAGPLTAIILWVLCGSDIPGEMGEDEHGNRILVRQPVPPHDTYRIFLLCRAAHCRTAFQADPEAHGAAPAGVSLARWNGDLIQGMVKRVILEGDDALGGLATRHWRLIERCLPPEWHEKPENAAQLLQQPIAAGGLLAAWLTSQHRNMTIGAQFTFGVVPYTYAGTQNGMQHLVWPGHVTIPEDGTDLLSRWERFLCAAWNRYPELDRLLPSELEPVAEAQRKADLMQKLP